MDTLERANELGRKLNPLSFTHRNEGFDCARCGFAAPPAQATCRNHCPRCLTSRHVDVDPGDRQNPCQGLMSAVSWQYDSRKWIILTHRCEICGFEGRNRSAPDDDLDRILALRARES